MKRFSQIFLYITIALLIIWQLPLVLFFLCGKAIEDSFLHVQ